MEDAYKLKDVVVRTYGGYDIAMDVNGIFRGPRLKTESYLIARMQETMKTDLHLRQILRNDIPVSIQFNRVFI